MNISPITFGNHKPKIKISLLPAQAFIGGKGVKSDAMAGGKGLKRDMLCGSPDVELPGVKEALQGTSGVMAAAIKSIKEGNPVYLKDLTKS